MIKNLLTRILSKTKREILTKKIASLLRVDITFDTFPPAELRIVETRKRTHLLRSEVALSRYEIENSPIDFLDFVKRDTAQKLGLDLLKNGFIKFETKSEDLYDYNPFERKFTMVVHVVEP